MEKPFGNLRIYRPPSAVFVLCVLSLMPVRVCEAASIGVVPAQQASPSATNDLPSSNAAYHGVLKFDPSKCSRDAEGMVYFAIRTRVFRQPVANLTYIMGNPWAGERSLPPPNPTDPLGCPGRPIQANGGYDLSQLSALPGARSRSPYADNISLAISGGSYSFTESRIFPLLCLKYSGRDTSISGFLGCKKPFRCGKDIAYRTSSYTAPDGENITLFCRVGIDCSEDANECDGGYKLYNNPDLNITFKFERSRLPIDQWQAADQEMRRRFHAAEVINYPWPMLLRK